MARGSAENRWRDRFDRWKRSGKTVTEFCHAEGVSRTMFYAWKRRLDQASADVVPALEFV
jgi:transposase